MCHSRGALSCVGIEPRSKSLGRLYSVPAAHGSFPTLSLRIFPRMLDPVPRRFHRVLSPVSSPVASAFPERRLGLLPAFVPRITTPRRPVFRGFRYFFMFRPPSLLTPRSSLPLRILPQGSRGFYIRAYRALLPPHAPDMLTVRIQAIDGTGTCTLLDSQPCRLLTSLHQHYPASSLLQDSPPLSGASVLSASRL